MVAVPEVLVVPRAVRGALWEMTAPATMTGCIAAAAAVLAVVLERRARGRRYLLEARVVVEMIRRGRGAPFHDGAYTFVPG